jgi:capsid protein
MAASDSGRRSFLQRATDALWDFFFLPQARYEGAYQGNYGERSLLFSTVQDARFDADKATRLELIRRARHWEGNSAIVNRLADVFEQYTVGCGLAITPKTEDEDFNQAAGQWWENWCKFPDIGSGLSFGSLQAQMARALFIDGEVFVHKTNSIDRPFRPRIQIIEAHRVGTPPHLASQEGKGIIDGAEFRMDERGNPIGRPLRWWVRVDSSPGGGGQGMWESVEGDRMILLSDQPRPGMIRSVTYLYPVLEDLHDLSDLQALEMKAAKNNARVANVVTNKTGEANLGAMRRERWTIQGRNAAGNATSKNAPLVSEMTVGGETWYVANGEKFEQFKSDRPGASTRDYWDYLVRKICAGVGISSLLVLPFSLQGTVTRADLDVAAAFFRSKSSLIQAVLREVYIWVMGWAVKFDRSLDGAPREWWHTSIRPPRSVNVDVGRNSQAILDEMEAGIRTFEDVCGELGNDWRTVLRQKAVEAKYVDDLARELKIHRDFISHFTMPTPLEDKAAAIDPTDPEEGGEPKEKPEEAAEETEDPFEAKRKEKSQA